MIKLPPGMLTQASVDMGEQPTVRRILISSTALDLPEHRRHARDACERMNHSPWSAPP